MSYNLLKKGLAIAIIFLFIGLALAPSINANVTLDTELVEITTEICGIDGIESKIVKLTKQESIKLEQLIDNIKIRLDKAETREETIEIFNDAIIKLDKYGLLCGLSVEQAQRLVVERWQNSKVFDLLENINQLFHVSETSDYINLFCLIATHIKGWNYMDWCIPSYLAIPLIGIGSLASANSYHIIGAITLFLGEFFLNYAMMKPIRILNNIKINCDILSFFSIGLCGIKIGNLGVHQINGFSGLKIILHINEERKPDDCFYFGKALQII